MKTDNDYSRIKPFDSAHQTNGDEAPEKSFRFQVKPYKIKKFLKEQIEIFQKKYVQQYQSYYVRFNTFKKGLKNIGNICYLNSVIQFIFGAEFFRQRLIQLSNRTSSTKIVKTLGQIFKYLKDTTDDINIEELLREITSLLHIDPYSQDDALKAFVNLINQVEDELPKGESLINLFQTEIEQRCSCHSKSSISETLYVSSEKCAGCEQPFIKKIINNPEYIILMEDEDEKKNQKPQEYLTLKGSDQLYWFVSQIVYSSKSNYGHYTCIRNERQTKEKGCCDKTPKTTSQIYLFNDQQVKYFKKKGEMEKSKMSLYRKVKSMKFIYTNYKCTFDNHELKRYVDKDGMLDWIRQKFGFEMI